MALLLEVAPPEPVVALLPLAVAGVPPVPLAVLVDAEGLPPLPPEEELSFPSSRPRIC